MPEWASGCGNRASVTETDQQSLDVVKEYRRRAISFDNIVQDWQILAAQRLGVPRRLIPNRFPDPDRLAQRPCMHCNTH